MKILEIERVVPYLISGGSFERACANFEFENEYYLADEEDDVNAFRAAAEQDVFDIYRAIYDRPESPVRTATVVGTSLSTTFSATAGSSTVVTACAGSSPQTPALGTVVALGNVGGICLGGVAGGAAVKR